MVAIVPVMTKANIGPGNTQVAWSTITEADTPSAFTLDAGGGSYGQKAVQLAGDFGGGTLAIHGSIDGVTYSVLHDPAGTDLSFTASGIQAIAENVPYMNVVRTGGTSMDVDVLIWGRSNHV